MDFVDRRHEDLPHTRLEDPECKKKHSMVTPTAKKIMWTAKRGWVDYLVPESFAALGGLEKPRKETHGSGELQPAVDGQTP